MKPRIKWSAVYRNWYHVSSWVRSDTDRYCTGFVISINLRNYRKIWHGKLH